MGCRSRHLSRLLRNSGDQMCSPSSSCRRTKSHILMDLPCARPGSGTCKADGCRIRKGWRCYRHQMLDRTVAAKPRNAPKATPLQGSMHVPLQGQRIKGKIQQQALASERMQSAVPEVRKWWLITGTPGRHGLTKACSSTRPDQCKLEQCESDQCSCRKSERRAAPHLKHTRVEGGPGAGDLSKHRELQIRLRLGVEPNLLQQLCAKPCLCLLCL